MYYIVTLYTCPIHHLIVVGRKNTFPRSDSSFSKTFLFRTITKQGIHFWTPRTKLVCPHFFQPSIGTLHPLSNFWCVRECFDTLCSLSPDKSYSALMYNHWKIRHDIKFVANIGQLQHFFPFSANIPNTGYQAKTAE